MTGVHYGENKPGTPSNKSMTTEPFLRDLDAEFSCKAAVRTDTFSDSMMNNQCGKHLSDHVNHTIGSCRNLRRFSESMARPEPLGTMW